MALPPIGYATTRDGVGIAFHTLGDGTTRTCPKSVDKFRTTRSDGAGWTVANILKGPRPVALLPHSVSNQLRKSSLTPSQFSPQATNGYAPAVCACFERPSLELCRRRASGRSLELQDREGVRAVNAGSNPEQLLPRAGGLAVSGDASLCSTHCPDDTRRFLVTRFAR